MKTSLSRVTLIGFCVLMAAFSARAGDDWGFSISISSGHVAASGHYQVGRTTHRHWHGYPGYRSACDRYSCDGVTVIPPRVTIYRPTPVVVCPPRVVVPRVVIPRVVTQTVWYSPSRRDDYRHYRNPVKSHSVCSSSRTDSRRDRGGRRH